MKDRLFTVIVLVYNNQEYLKECLDSILIQDYPYIEIIIADDHSRHFDADIFSSYIENNNQGNILKYNVYSNVENYGTVKNINEALKHRCGKYIKLLAADDALYDSHVLYNAKCGLDLANEGMIVSNVVICDQNMKPTGKKSKFDQSLIGKFDSNKLFQELCKTNIIDAQGVFLSEEFFDRYGLFSEKFKLLEDWPKWLEFSAKGGKPLYCDFIACKYRSDCGVGTGINPVYLKDKKNTFDLYVRKNRNKIGIANYIVSKIRFVLTTSSLIRKIYSAIYRNRE